MYSSGSLCARPAWNSGASRPITSPASRSSADISLRRFATSRSTARSGASAAYFTIVPGRAEAVPPPPGSRARHRCAGGGGRRCARNLGRGERIAPNEGHVGARLVGREPEADQALDRRLIVHRREHTTLAVVAAMPHPAATAALVTGS